MLDVRKILTSLTRKLSYLLCILLFYNNVVHRIETGGRGGKTEPQNEQSNAGGTVGTENSE
jgi:hypothetical protein